MILVLVFVCKDKLPLLHVQSLGGSGRKLHFMSLSKETGELQDTQEVESFRWRGLIFPLVNNELLFSGVSFDIRVVGFSPSAAVFLFKRLLARPSFIVIALDGHLYIRLRLNSCIDLLEYSREFHHVEDVLVGRHALGNSEMNHEGKESNYETRHCNDRSLKTTLSHNYHPSNNKEQEDNVTEDGKADVTAI